MTEKKKEDTWETGYHAGHRKRLRRRFAEHGLDNFDDHTALELLLTYAIPKKDVNPLAHKLINTFGSFAGVLNAGYSELMEIEGIGENTAVLLSMMPEISKRYALDMEKGGKIMETPVKTGEYVRNMLRGEREETVLVIGLDHNYELCVSKELFRGSFTEVTIHVQKIVRLALTYDCMGIILAHNHPKGSAEPSDEDIETTQRLKNALNAVGLDLVDHIIVGRNGYTSLMMKGEI